MKRTNISSTFEQYLLNYKKRRSQKLFNEKIYRPLRYMALYFTQKYDISQYRLDVDDIVQLLVLAALKSIKNFDPKRNVSIKKRLQFVMQQTMQRLYAFQRRSNRDIRLTTSLDVNPDKYELIADVESDHLRHNYELMDEAKYWVSEYMRLHTWNTKDSYWKRMWAVIQDAVSSEDKYKNFDVYEIAKIVGVKPHRVSCVVSTFKYWIVSEKKKRNIL